MAMTTTIAANSVDFSQIEIWSPQDPVVQAMVALAGPAVLEELALGRSSTDPRNQLPTHRTLTKDGRRMLWGLAISRYAEWLEDPIPALRGDVLRAGTNFDMSWRLEIPRTPGVIFIAKEELLPSPAYRLLVGPLFLGQRTHYTGITTAIRGTYYVTNGNPAFEQGLADGAAEHLVYGLDPGRSLEDADTYRKGFLWSAAGGKGRPPFPFSVAEWFVRHMPDTARGLSAALVGFAGDDAAQFESALAEALNG